MLAEAEAALERVRLFGDLLIGGILRDSFRMGQTVISSGTRPTGGRGFETTTGDLR